MDWIFGVAGGLLWLAAYGLAQGCSTLQVRSQGGAVMTSGWMILAAVLAAGLLVYLVAALLRPEDFS